VVVSHEPLSVSEIAEVSEAIVCVFWCEVVSAADDSFLDYGVEGDDRGGGVK